MMGEEEREARENISKKRGSMGKSWMSHFPSQASVSPPIKGEDESHRRSWICQGFEYYWELAVCG